MTAEVRRQVKYGADWIKLYATGTLRHVDSASLEPMGQVSLEDVKAVVAEAKRWRRDVAAHAYGGEGAKNAIRGGVRSIEHGMMLDDEALKLMVERAGTRARRYRSISRNSKRTTPRCAAGSSPVTDLFQKAMKMGVKIVFGTDVGAFEHGTSAREFVRMVESA